jgi:uncharacterized protein YbbK (DUF523 family)
MTVPFPLGGNMKILVSACLMGRNCKYNGGNNYCEQLQKFVRGREVIEVCPEVLAGLGTPRTPIEIRDGIVVSRDGVVVDGKIRAAVAQILEEIKDEDIEVCVLKSRSPTCGVKQVYDGSFSGRLIDGSGVLAQALEDAGYRVLDAEEIP